MNDLINNDDNLGVTLQPQGSHLLDPVRYELTVKVADKMAMSSLIPDSLKFDVEVNPETGEPITGKKQELSLERIQANCFLITNWAFGVGMDPFAVAQGTSIVRGRLMFEGKIVAAALNSQLRVKLKASYGVWDPLKAVTIVGGEATGKDLAVRVYEELPDGSVGRYVDGYVGGWETTRKGSPWAQNKDWRKLLVYRGTREWARVFEPGVMLGVITTDEYEPSWDNMRDITPTRQQSTGSDVIDRLKAAKSGAGDKPAAGFDQDRINETTKAADATGKSDAFPGDSDASTSANARSAPKDQTKAETENNGRPTAMDYEWLRKIATGLWAATNYNGDATVLKNQRIALGGSYPSKGVHKSILEKAKSIMDACLSVCEGKVKPADARKLIAGIAGMEVHDLAEKVAK